ncbi:MAG: hypothetical protein JNM63_04410 [Spirochaetia bacterium]|nr:hypothetical protein [Spirochaetia bacterium]
MAFGLFLSQGKVHGYAFNPWTTITGDKTFAINPFFYTTVGSNSVVYSMDMLFQTGLSSNVDVFFNVATLGLTASTSNGAAGTPSYAGTWIMPRIDIGSGIVLGLNLGYAGTSGSYAYVQPEFHGFWETDIFAFEATVKYQFGALPNLIGTPASLQMTGSAFLAPVLKIAKDIFHIYLEIDPTIVIPTAKGSSTSFSLLFEPGLWFKLGGSHQISIAWTGLGLTSGTFAATPSFGMWYYTTWGLK